MQAAVKGKSKKVGKKAAKKMLSHGSKGKRPKRGRKQARKRY